MQATMNEHNSSEATKKMTQDFEYKLKLTPEEDYDDESSGQESHEEEYYEEDGDEEFSFSLDGVDFSTISAEDAFDNGQIKPVFPLFNRDLLLQDGEDLESLRLKDRLPKVKKVFVEAEDDDLNATTSSTGDEDIVGPCCEWSKKVVEAAPEGCKKSNSTGFSKIWRFKDLMHRSSSDGRDAFVFLNNSTPSSSTSTEAAPAAPVTVKREEKAVTTGVEKESSSLKKVNASGGAGGEVKKVKRVKKPKTATLSAHEVYMRSKAKDADRRKSYLPYRPELVGLFTNVNGGGLTRNVHPY